MVMWCLQDTLGAIFLLNSRMISGVSFRERALRIFPGIVLSEEDWKSVCHCLSNTEIGAIAIREF